MEEKRKIAYRYLLYHAMLDIRPIGWMPITVLQLLNPLGWKTFRQRIRRAGIVADWLHNLALFLLWTSSASMRNGSGESFKSSRRRHPDISVASYREIFERELSGTGHIKNGLSNPGT